MSGTTAISGVSGRKAFLARRLVERRERYRAGLWAEVLASVILSLKGYRILARRHKTWAGEIDLIAVRGHTLAFVEVKARATLDAAQTSISDLQSRRIRDAAGLWVARSPRYRNYDQRFDALYVIPGRLPVHETGAA
jgi:putative endonuclease